MATKSKAKSKSKAAPAPEALEPAVAPVSQLLEPDVKDVASGSGKGELTPPLNAETWVVLNGKHKAVPDRYDGKIAAVIDWPTSTAVDEATGKTTEYLPDNAILTVRERSQNALLTVPLAACKEIHRNGRPGVLGFA